MNRRNFPALFAVLALVALLVGGDRLGAQTNSYHVTSSTAGQTGVPTTRTITAGTGLSGGGDLSANRTLAVSFGTSSSTACVGDDSRLSNARTPTAHASTHGSGGADAVSIAASQVSDSTSTGRSVLTAASTAAARTAIGAGTFTSPLTTAGDLLTYTATDARLAIGSTGYALGVVAGAPAWALPSALVTAASDATALRAVLFNQTDYDFSSSSGWTLENGTVGSGSATITGGVARLAIGSSGNCTFTVGDSSAPRIRRALPTLRDPWRFRVEARIASVGTGGTGSNVWYMTLGLRNTTGTVRGVNFRVGFDGRPDGVTHNGGTQVATGNGAEITVAGGDAWIAIEVDRTILRLLYGYGSGGGATRPTTWTQQYVSSTLYSTFGVSQGGSASAPLPWSEVFLTFERTVSTVGAAGTADIDDVRAIDLQP